LITRSYKDFAQVLTLKDFATTPSHNLIPICWGIDVIFGRRDFNNTH